MTAGLAGLNVASEATIKEMNALGDDLRFRLRGMLFQYGIHDLDTTLSTLTN